MTTDKLKGIRHGLRVAYWALSNVRAELDGECGDNRPAKVADELAEKAWWAITDALTVLDGEQWLVDAATSA